MTCILNWCNCKKNFGSAYNLAHLLYCLNHNVRRRNQLDTLCTLDNYFLDSYESYRHMICSVELLEMKIKQSK